MRPSARREGSPDRGRPRRLALIGHYIARDDPSRAVTFVAELRAKCLGLREAPRTFPLADEFGLPGVRKRRHGRYLILYRIERDRVEVLHVVHGAVNYSALLSGDRGGSS